VKRNAWAAALSLTLGAGGTATAAAQTPATTPLPEYHGTYAVAHGMLVGLDVTPSQSTLRRVEVRLGQRAAVADLLRGAAIGSSASVALPELPSDAYFLVYRPTGLFGFGAIDIARNLRLQPMAYVRNVSTDTGWPQNVKGSGVENAWDSGSPTELLGLGDPLDKPVPLLTKSLSGHPDVTLAVPSSPLAPGVYELSLGFGPLKDLSFGFAVESLDQARVAKCPDVSYTYSMNLSSGKATSCSGRPAPRPGRASPTPSPPRSPDTDFPGPIPRWTDCGGTEAAYDILLEDRPYRLRRGRNSTGGPVRFFTSQDGFVERDPAILANLATAVWTVESVVRDFQVRAGASQTRSVRETLQSLLKYGETQDALIRADVMAIKIALTGGAGAVALLGDITEATWDKLRKTLSDPRTWMTTRALAYLVEAENAYITLESQLPPRVKNGFDAGDLKRARESYYVADGFGQLGTTLAVTLMPKSGWALVDQALSSLASGLVGALPSSRARLTLEEMLRTLDLLSGFAKTIPTLEPYAETYERVKLSPSVQDKTTAKWAVEAAMACVVANDAGKPLLLPYVEREAHPFEGATYGAWTALQPLSVLEEPDPGARRLGEIPAGAPLVAETGETHTVRHGRVVVDEDRTVTVRLPGRQGFGDMGSYGSGGQTRLLLARGDTLFIVGCYGEGACRYWQGGRFVDFGIDLPPNSWTHLEEPLVSEWWVLVRTKAGLRGWVKDPKANGMDAFS